MIKNFNILLAFLICTISAKADDYYWAKVKDFTSTNIVSIQASGGTVYAAREKGGLWLSSDQGKTWEMKENGEFKCMIIKNDGTIFAGQKEDGIIRSTNGGASFKDANDGIDDNIQGLKPVLAMAADSNGNIWAAVKAGGLYKSNNNGNSWTRVNADLFNEFKTIQTIAIGRDGKIFLGLYNNGIYTSEDDGESWEYFELNENQVLNSVISLCAYKPHELLNYCIAGTNHNGVFLSTDNGKNWEQIPDEELKSVFAYRSFLPADTILFAGTHKGGLYITRDDCETWNKSNEDIDSRIINDICFSYEDSYYAATDDGVFKYIRVKGALAIEVNRDISEDELLLPGDRIVFEVKVLDDQGEALEGADVYAVSNIDNIQKQFQSDVRGYVLYTYEIPADAVRGDYYMTFRAEMDEYKNSPKKSSLMQVRTADSLSLFVEITPELKQEITLGDEVKYSITVKDYKDQPVENATITVTDALMAVQPQLLTDANGSSTYTVIPDEETRQAEYRIDFNIEADGFNPLPTESRFIKYNYSDEKIINMIILPDSSIVLKQGELLELKAGVTDYELTPLSGVTISYDDKLVNDEGTIESGSDGIAEYSYTIFNDKTPGKYLMIFKASKDGYHTTDTIQKYVEVIDANSVVEISSSNMNIYPNPANGHIYFSIDDENIDNAEISIINIIGEVIFTSNILNNNEIHKIDISGFASGNYFLSIKTGKKLYHKKFLIVN